jgi:hypothetical protein
MSKEISQPESCVLVLLQFFLAHYGQWFLSPFLSLPILSNLKNLIEVNFLYFFTHRFMLFHYLSPYCYCILLPSFKYVNAVSLCYYVTTSLVLNNYYYLH